MTSIGIARVLLCRRTKRVKIVEETGGRRWILRMRIIRMGGLGLRRDRRNGVPGKRMWMSSMGRQSLHHVLIIW